MAEKQLNDRKKKVLQAIVEEYINTAEPVSSNALTSNEELQYSSATIRNEMADLEKSRIHRKNAYIKSEEYHQKKVIDTMLMNY